MILEQCRACDIRVYDQLPLPIVGLVTVISVELNVRCESQIIIRATFDSLLTLNPGDVVFRALE